MQIVLNRHIESVLNDIADACPNDTAAFLIAGSVRDAIVGKRTFPKDLDIKVAGDMPGLCNALRKNGYKYLQILARRRTRRMKKPSAPLLDISQLAGSSATAIRRWIKSCDFTVNAVALQLTNRKIVAHKDAIKHIMSKELHVCAKKVPYNTRIFAAVRLIGKGYNPPPAQEVKALVSELKEISKKDYDHAVAKTLWRLGFDKSKFRHAVDKLRLNFDLLSYKAVKKL